MADTEEWFQRIKSDWAGVSTYGQTTLFSSFNELEQFVITELKFWEEFKKGQLGIYNNSSRQLMGFINAARQQDITEQVFKDRIRDIVNILNISKNQKNYLPSYLPEAQFLARLYRQNPNQADAAWKFLYAKEQQLILNSADSFAGAAEAFNFSESLKKDDSLRTENERLDSVAAKFQELTHQFTSNYLGSQKEMVSKFDNKLSEFTKINDDSKLKLQTQEKDFQNSMAGWQGTIVQLEKQYGELMKLKKPAEYWDKLFTDYTTDGKNWRTWALATSGVFVCILLPILYWFPEWLKGNTWTIDHVKGVLLLAIIISVFSYLINLFAKLSISSFHLAKDAKELYQLTYVYLSMISEKAIDPDKDRQIVLQALFSRADTGLLKSDGAPTMPSVQNIIELAKK